MAMYTSSYINKALATRPEGPRHEGQVEGEKTIQPSVARQAAAAFVRHMHMLNETKPYIFMGQAHSGSCRPICQAVTGL